MLPAESDSTSTRVRSPPVHDPRDPQGETAADRDGRLWAWCGLALILCVALGLRLWGIKEGLPYVYNIDEAGHFVPKAVHMFLKGLTRATSSIRPRSPTYCTLCSTLGSGEPTACIANTRAIRAKYSW